jgi:glycosyltransferase involved in cell wall biosynthesis
MEGSTTRVDMHCHSTASEVSKLGVQRALGLPECAMPPEEVYELAKRRGMDFVTITDHDTIDGVLTIADRPGVFVSKELTAHFRGEPQAVHVLCYGITPEDHEWLQANSCDVELCAMYLYDREIACALAHPYYAVGAPLSARHRRRLAELFEIWETRNGARARELNRPAAMYVAAIPYAPATAFQAKEQAKLARYGASADGEPPRVAILADGIGSTHGVSRTIEEIRRRGVEGFEIEVVATDPDVDRRLPAVAELEVPYYPGLRIGVPSLTAAVQVLAEGDFDALHVCSPGPVGIAGALLARALGLPLIGSYHTELTAYAKLRSQSQGLAEAMGMAVGAFYHACDLVLSPSPASDEALASIGMGAEKVMRWDRGVDTARFDPALRSKELRGAWMEGLACPGRSSANRKVPEPIRLRRECPRVHVLYAGRITREKGAELLVETFLAARARDPRLHLVLAGGGPEQERVRERAGEHATFLGWLEGADLARAYASADVFLFPSSTDTFGQVILEAQASGLPVLAVAEGGPLALMRDGVSGLLREADAEQLADGLLKLADSPLLRERLARAGLSAARERTWEGALERLGAGYRRALAGEARDSLDGDRLVA